MFESFETYITSRIDLTTDQLAQMRSLSITRKVRRRQLLLQEGDVCLYKAFVARGLLKTCRVKDDGTEYIMRFSPENSWAIDSESYNNQTPSKYNIEALEDTEVLLWSREHIRDLFVSIPAFRSFSENFVANSLYASQERIFTNISATSEEKYQDFIASFPDVFRRVPLHLVASYLGVSRETLSRIRHTRVKQQKGNGIG